MHLLLFTKQTCMLWNGYEHESDSNITRTSNAIANKSPSTAMYEGETPFRLSIIFSARTYLKDPTMSRYIFRTGCQFFKLNKLTTTWHGCRGEVNHVTLQIKGIKWVINTMIIVLQHHQWWLVTYLRCYDDDDDMWWHRTLLVPNFRR